MVVFIFLIFWIYPDTLKGTRKLTRANWISRLCRNGGRVAISVGNGRERSLPLIYVIEIATERETLLAMGIYIGKVLLEMR